MKKILRSVMLVLAMMSMTVPALNAQHHGERGNNSRTERTRQSHNRRESATPQRGQSREVQTSTSGRPGLNAGSSASRPGQVNNGGNRPSQGNNGNHNNRPGQGNTGNHNNRPNQGNLGNGNAGNRPGVGTSGRPGVGNNHNRPSVAPGNNGHRPEVGPAPVAPTRPGVGRPVPGGNRPGNVVGNRPGFSPNRPPMIAPPQRPFRPVIRRPAFRPVPPPAWRPRPGIPVIRGILGLTFGAAFNISLDYLYNSGYTVDGYGNNIVYLRNVPVMNYIWTDGALYYGNAGLDASSFYYSTPGYDLSRYNAVYSSLVNTYGMPVSVNNAAGSMSATWFGGNSGYVTLSFGSGQAGRFLTTLTFGL